MSSINIKETVFNCEFCNKTFSTSYNLKNHKNTAKFCLQLQNKEIENSFICDFCNKGFTTKIHHSTHVSTCKVKKEIEEKELEKENIKTNKELLKRDKIISDLKAKLSSKDDIIKKLQKENKELLKRTANTNTNTTINNNDNRQTQYTIQFNQYFDSLSVLNEANVTNRINVLNNEELINQYDFGNFYPGFLNNLANALKDFSFCTDLARKTLVTKDENLKPVKMSAEELLSKCFNLGNESIQEHFTLTEQIVDDKINNCDPDLTAKMLDLFEEDIKKLKDATKTDKNFFNNTDEGIERLKLLNGYVKLVNHLKTNKGISELLNNNVSNN
jgi:hypothetical protein